VQLPADVSGGTAHVKANNGLLVVGLLLSGGGHGVADNSTGRSRQNRSRSVEGVHWSEASVRLHEGDLDAVEVVDEPGGEALEVLLDAGCEVSVNLFGGKSKVGRFSIEIYCSNNLAYFSIYRED